jgi:hypothetical protein
MRVVARKPRRGDIHALSATDIRAFVQRLPVEQLRELKRIELRAREGDVGDPFALYRREERDILLYSTPPDEWWMTSLDRGCAADLKRAGAGIVRHKHGVSIHFSDDAMQSFMRDVLAHELGHHLRNIGRGRYPRVGRTADEEAFADLHARRVRRLR